MNRSADLPAPVTRPSLRPRIDGEHVLELRAGPVLTSAVRIVVDCARLLPREWGLALADAAIAGGWVQPAEPQAAGELVQVQGLTGPRGIRTARWVLAHARADVESPLESLARAVILAGGFLEPLPQQWIRTAAGPFRVDLLDVQNRVITEADGKLEYEPGDRGDDRESEALWNEKLRQDALRDEGYEVVRFVMKNFHHPTPWHRRYAAAMARSRRQR